MYDRIIDDYLSRVTKDMGHKQRDDVKTELRSHILDSADALAAERNTAVDESIVREVIARMGPADKLAAEYPVRGGIMRDRVILAIGGIIALILVLAVISAAVGACTLMSLAPMQNGFSFVTEHKEANASHAAAKNVTIDVSSFNGGVEILESNSDDVEVKVVMSAPQGRLDQITADTRFDGNADDLKVDVDVRRLTNTVARGGFGSYGGNVYVYVPSNSATAITVETSNGAIHVGDFTGSIVKLDTSNAGITIDGGAYDRIDAKTSNGRVYAKYNSTDASFETSNSAIELDAEQTLGQLRAITSNGRVKLDLPDTAGYTIDASTSNGQIRHGTIPMALTTYEKNHIVGHTDNFGAENFSVYLRTSNSGIEIS